MTALPTHAPMPADRNDNNETTATTNDTPVRPTERGAALRWALDALPDEIRDAIADAAHAAERREAADELRWLMRTFRFSDVTFDDALVIARKSGMEESRALLADSCRSEIDCAIDGTKRLLAAYNHAAALAAYNHAAVAEWLDWIEWADYSPRAVALEGREFVRTAARRSYSHVDIVHYGLARVHDDDMNRRLIRVNALVDGRLHGEAKDEYFTPRVNWDHTSDYSYYYLDRSHPDRLDAPMESARLAERIARKFGPTPEERARVACHHGKGRGRGGRGVGRGGSEWW